jgi:hypothetical protein
LIPYDLLIIIWKMSDSLEVHIGKSLMKNCSATYGKTRETLPLEGDGKGVGVKGLIGIAKRLRKRAITPHPVPLPKGRGEMTFENTWKAKGRAIWLAEIGFAL